MLIVASVDNSTKSNQSMLLLFRSACNTCWTHIQYIISNFPEYNFIDNGAAIRFIYSYNRLDLMEQLLKTYDHTNNIAVDDVYMHALSNSNYDVTMLLDGLVSISTINKAFINSILADNVNGCGYILDEHTNIDYTLGFITCCKYNKLSILKHLICYIDLDLDMYDTIRYCFINVCMYNWLDMAKWFIKYFDTNTFEDVLVHAFLQTCKLGLYNMTKLLLNHTDLVYKLNNDNKMSALDLAIASSNYKLAHLLFVMWPELNLSKYPANCIQISWMKRQSRIYNKTASILNSLNDNCKLLSGVIDNIRYIRSSLQTNSS